MSTTPPHQRLPRRINKRSGTTRERTGCLTCRQRKKRCDLGYPVCKECVRLNYQCNWEEPRLVAHNPSQTASQHRQVQSTVNSSFRLSRVPDPVLFWGVEHADHTSPSSRRHFMRYYTQTFTHLLTTNIENNSFLSAMHNTPLLNALISWSSSHLSLRDSTFHQVAMHNRCYALQDLRQSLESDPANVETNLAITLVLCSLESIMADNNNAWYLHLLGAAGIISSQLPIEDEHTEDKLSHVVSTFTDPYSGKWLLRNFAYHDIMMAVATDRAPLLESHHFLKLDDASLADSYFGLAADVLEVLSHTATLNAQIKTALSHGSDIQPGDAKCDTPNITTHPPIPALIAQLQSLEVRLTEWTCPTTPDTCLTILAESYRSSALIFIYRVLSRAKQTRSDNVSEKTAVQVSKIVENIDRMPKRSLPECTLLFPLFIAGGEATNSSHIGIIQQRLKDMIESRGFGNVRVALSVLEKLWRLRIARNDGVGEGVRVDWLDIVQQEQISLSLS